MLTKTSGPLFPYPSEPYDTYHLLYNSIYNNNVYNSISIYKYKILI